MIKTIIRTILLVAAVLVAAQFVPFVAEHQTLLLIAAVVLGLLGFIIKAIFAVIAIGVVWLLLTNYL